MKTFRIFSLAAVFYCLAISCNNKMSDDDLAIKISRSNNFKEILDNGKSMANHISNLHDSIKKIMKYYKFKLNSIQKSNLNFLAKRDSLIKIIKIVSRLDTGLIDREKTLETFIKNSILNSLSI